MSNTYLKMMNKRIQNQYIDSIISDVQHNLKSETSFDNLDLYDLLSNINKEKTDVDINKLLKYYVLNQLVKEENPPQKEEISFVDTNNPKIKICTKDNTYYKLSNNKYDKAPEIETVNEDGSYITVEEIKLSLYKIKKEYDANCNVCSIQLIGPDGNIEKNKYHIAEILSMRKEVTQKHKYSGFSGNSFDIITAILNKLSTPIETGCYMDKNYNIYRWSEIKKAFVRNFKSEAKSPFLTEYEFANNIVIRKDYTGIQK